MLKFEVTDEVVLDRRRAQGYSLTGAQVERVKIMAKVHRVNSSRLIAALIDTEWVEFTRNKKRNKT